jgi:hypothetical protein
MGATETPAISAARGAGPGELYSGGRVMGDFFSRTSMMAIGLLLLTVIAWAAWRLGPTALERWFG